MQLRYAFYERIQSGYHWTWRAAGLADAVLQDFVFRIEKPSDSNSISAGIVRGGICKFDRVLDGVVEEHVVLYRFFDGGSDAGRPNRFAMLTAWTTPQQVLEIPGRYGVSALLRNRVFEYVAENARTVGLAPPPFCASLVAEEEIPHSHAGRLPSAAVMEFIVECLTDRDSDSYVTIRDKEYSLIKKPSGLFERRRKEGEVRKPQQSAQEGATIEYPGGSEQRGVGGGVDAGVGLPSQGTRKGKGKGSMVRAGIALAVFSLGVVFAVGAMQYGSQFSWWGRTLSQEALQVQRLFEGLSLEEQQAVLRHLYEVCHRRQNQDGRQGSAMNPYAQPAPVAGPAADGRQLFTPNGGGSPSEPAGRGAK